MANFVPLNNNDHADLKVVHEYRADCGAQVNQVRAFITEFDELHKEYPIFFRKADDGSFYAVSILGLDTDENLFLSGTSWTGRYIPAALRRGPFRVGVTATPQTGGADEAGGATIHMDLDDPRVGTTEGVALFEPNGGHTAFLHQITKTLRSIHVGIQNEPAFFAELQKLSLIAPVTVQVTVSDEKGYTIPDLFTVNREALLGLDASETHRIHQSGLLALCYWVISASNNMDRLTERKLQQSAE